jgi:acyl phosphate:glycerol-3-phosphate acyltransferase
MEKLIIILSIVLGYAFGCIQTAYIIGRSVKKIDIREHGTNNAGASNVTRVLGWKYGAITALVDILKAVVPVIAFRFLYPDNLFPALLCGTFVILGHIFPINLGFKGGKGAASFIGMFLAFDIRIGIAMILIIVILTLILDYIALGTVMMFTAAPVLTYLWNYRIECIVLGIVLALVCYYKHYINIVRIVKGEEVGLRRVVQNNKGK